MSLNLGTMYALVTLDDADYRKKLNGLEEASTSSFQNIAKAAAAYLTLRAVTGFVRSTVGMYSDLEEETNKFNVVFAGMGERTSKVLAQMREDFGLFELSAKRMLAGTGDMLTGLGFDPKLALVLSEGTAKLGADIASFSNYAGGAAGATSALTKAMLGEAESAKLLGVVIKQDSEEMKALKEQAMTTGITIEALGDAGKNIVVSNENQAKAVAALALAYQQSPNAIGDFKRSQDSIANQSRILENNFEELTSKIGGDLAPAYRDTLSLTNQIIKKYNELSPASRMLINNTVALTAAMAALSTTKIGRSIMTFKGNSSEDIEAAKEKAVENVKRAEVRMTTAQLEKDLAQQNLSLAKNATAAAENAVVFAKAEKAKADASGDSVRIAKAALAVSVAEKNLTEAKIKEAQAVSTLTEKTSALTAATAEYNTLSTQLPSVLSSIAASATLAGNASIFLSGGFKAAAVAAKGFFASIGPIGWAILALGGAYALASAMQKKYKAELDATTESSSKRLELARKMTATHHQEANSATAQFMRLKELAKYERLNNAEMEEANGLIKTLTGLYGELGISIDKASGKLVIATNAFGKMNEEQSKIALKDKVKEYQALIALTTSKGNELHNEVSDIFTSGFAYQAYNLLMRSMGNNPEWLELMDKKAFNNIQNQVSSAQKLAKTKDQIIAFQKIYQKLVEEGGNEEAQKALELVKLLQEQLKLESDIEKIRNGNTEPQGNKGGKKPEEAEKESKKLRDALVSLADTEFEISFNFSDASQQADMLNQKIQDILSQQSGKYANVDTFVSADRHKMNEQEIKDLEKILDLEARRAEIERESAKDLELEQESYADMLDERFKQYQERRIEKELKAAQSSKNSEEVNAIMQRELTAARKAAQQMEREYLSALEAAQKDEIYTKEEREKVAALKRKWQESLSDQDKWQSRIDMNNDRQEKNVAKTVGSFSLQVLASQLGGATKPELETAKNTKRMKELLEQMNETTGRVYEWQ